MWWCWYSGDRNTWEVANGQGLAAAARPSGTALIVESGVKIAPILARSGRLQPIVRRSCRYRFNRGLYGYFMGILGL